MGDNEKGRSPQPWEELTFSTSILDTAITPTSRTFPNPQPTAGFSEKPAPPLATHRERDDEGSDNTSAIEGDTAGGLELTPTKTDALNVYRKMSDTVSDYHQLVQDSKTAGDNERNMTVREGLKLYPKAIMWSIMLSMTLVMEGYDLNIINGFFALPEFQERYGNYIGKGQWSISSPWQSGLTNGAVTGEIVGLLFNGTKFDLFTCSTDNVQDTSLNGSAIDDVLW